ncbi:uncharacterized protein [Arachis hypogaea]|uniref:uncharacterized protein n=1 Tax=Arachis hypogaea TaxID=3818 RepID=UPI000DECBC45|nr:uric acid degradation bifunctional protein TTL-like [Arachis hypogaea]
MASTFPFSSLRHAFNAAFDVWCNKINVHSWLIAPNAHTNICEKFLFSHAFYTSVPSSVMNSSIEEIYALNKQYLQRFEFPYFTIFSFWDGDVILMDLKTSVTNKSAYEFEWACRKQFIIIKQHISKFFCKRGYVRSTNKSPEIQAAVKDFDLNKKPFWKDDLDPVAYEKARRFCEIWNPGE